MAEAERNDFIHNAISKGPSPSLRQCSGLSVGAVDPREGTRMGDELRKCLASGLSVGAFDRTSRDLVGIGLSYACAKDGETDGDAGLSPPCELV